MAYYVFDDFKTMLRHLKVYLLGKGILTLGVLAAAGISAAMGFSVLLPAIVVGVGGTLLTAADRFYQRGLYQDEMVDLYRDDIANQLGIKREDVTRASLKEAAKDNDVIAQALKRQDQKTILSIGTAALSGIVSIALIVGFGLDTKTLQTMAQGSLWNALKPLASFIGIGTVSGVTSLLLRDGLGTAIGYGTGINKAAAHDLITKLDLEVKRGLSISREEIYGIIAAANPALDKTITEQYGKHYNSLSHALQAQVLHDAGMEVTMDKLAVAIAHHQVRPGYMAYAANDPRLNVLPERTIYPEPANDQPKGNFVARLGLTSRSEELSHTARLENARAEPSAGYSSAIL